MRNDDAESENPEVQYVWSRRYIDAPVCRDRGVAAGGDLGVTDSGLDERLYYTTDANMNVTALLDTAGDAVERYVYDPYGRVTVYSDDWSTTVDWDDSKKNPVRYCGYFFDNETGLYCVRYRFYVPPLGRWLGRDPIGYGDGMSLYEYVKSRPSNIIDPDGLRTLRGPNGQAVEVDDIPYTGSKPSGAVGSGFKCPGGNWLCWGGTVDLMFFKGRQGTLGKCRCLSKAHVADWVFYCPCPDYEVCRVKQFKRASCRVVVNTECWGPNVTCDVGLSVWEVSGAFDGSQLAGTEVSGSLEATGVWDIFQKGIKAALKGGFSMGPGVEGTVTESGPGGTISWGAGAGAAVGARVRTTVLDCTYGPASKDENAWSECIKKIRGFGRGCVILEPVVD